MLKRLWSRDSHKAAALGLYDQVVGQARRPEFYAHCGVPDSLDGRFELILLHCFLVLNRLNDDRQRTSGLAQKLFDTMFQNMDLNLREMGVGDLGVGKRIKVMVLAFYGRVSAYEAAIEEGEVALVAALRRNLYGTAEPEPRQVETVARYIASEVAGLGRQELADLMAGKVSFGAPPPASLRATGQSTGDPALSNRVGGEGG